MQSGRRVTCRIGIAAGASGIRRRPAGQHLEVIFEPFRRLDKNGCRGGAGLGLSIVQAVARRYGGEAVAESRPGGGLVVRVTLPGISRESSV
jgi:signal transduction histidine kinase